MMKRYYFQVSDGKGYNGGYFDSDCGAFCPQQCIGTWNIIKRGHWEKDSTLAVNKQGNTGSIYWIPLVVKILEQIFRLLCILFHHGR